MVHPMHEICCIGAGRTGVFSMIALAHRVQNIQITVVDDDVDLINRWLSPNLPFHEPELNHYINLYRGNKINFSVNVDHHLATAETIFVCVELETKDYGIHAGECIDYCEWERMVVRVSEHALETKNVIDKSGAQFPSCDARSEVGSSNKFHELLNDNPHKPRHRLYSNPEFSSRGTAMQNVLNPDKVVLGCKSNDPIEAIMHLYDWVAPDRIIVLDGHNDAEFGKLASDLYLGLTGILGNIIASLCDKMGVDIVNVMNVVQGDRRMHQIVTPHGAIGGPELLRDIRFAAYLCDRYNLKEQALLLKHHIRINKLMKEDFVGKMEHTMTSLTNKVVVILGFAIKEQTDDVSDSAGLHICELLLKKKARVRVVDPWVNAEVITACYPPRYAASGMIQVFGIDQLAQAWIGADAGCAVMRSDVSR